MLSIERLEDASALPGLVEDWAALEADLSPRLPFRTPHWNMLWWKHFREDCWRVSDSLRVYVVRDEIGKLIAVAPMMLTRRPGRFWPLATELQFFGADPNITELRGPVVRNEDLPSVVDSLNTEFRRERGRWGWIHWSGLALGQAVRAAVERGGRTRWTDEIPDFFLELPATWDEFRAGLSRNIKESLRKCYNSLKREGHAFTFRAVSDPAEVPAALDRFFELHAERSALKSSVEHPNVFEESRARAFLVDYCMHEARHDRLRVFQLEIAGVVVATRIGFLMGDELFLYYSGYLQSWGPFSVMTTTLAETLRWSIEQKLRRVNLSTGNDVSKTRWSPSSVSFARGVQLSDHWHQRLRYGIYQFARSHSGPDSLLHGLMNFLRRRKD